jgi:outer membrane protein assembly factor BamD (BamD/ComL family)
MIWVLRFPLDSRILLIAAVLCPLGLWLERRRESLRGLLWPLVFLIGYTAALCLFFMTSRHRLPVLPIAIMLGAGTVTSICRLAVRRSPGQRVRALTLGGSLVLLIGVSFLLYERPSARYHLTYTGAHKLYNQGLVLSRQGRFEEAVELFAASLEQRESPSVRFEMASALVGSRRSREAIEHIERCVELEPTHARAWSNLGYLRESILRDYQAARAAYENAVRLAPGDANAYFRLGHVCLELKDPAAALDHFKRFLQLAPPDSPHRRDAQRKIVAAEMLLEVLPPREPGPQE